MSLRRSGTMTTLTFPPAENGQKLCSNPSFLFLMTFGLLRLSNVVPKPSWLYRSRTHRCLYRHESTSSESTQSRGPTSRWFGDFPRPGRREHCRLWDGPRTVVNVSRFLTKLTEPQTDGTGSEPNNNKSEDVLSGNFRCDEHRSLNPSFTD